MSDTIKVQLVKSGIGRPEKHKRTLVALGLTKMNKIVEHPDNDQIRGMINKVPHLVKVVDD